MTQLDVAVGDDILIGDRSFEIRGVVLREPGGGIGAFSFGPRVLIDYDDLLETGLLTLGTRAERQILVRVPEPRVDPLVASLREPLRDEFVRVRSYRNTEDRIARNLSRAEDYLSLIGFVVVVLGGIGVWSVTRVFVQQRGAQRRRPQVPGGRRAARCWPSTSFRSRSWGWGARSSGAWRWRPACWRRCRPRSPLGRRPSRGSRISPTA